MALTSPYRQNHYLGEFATDALVLAFIQAELWDSLGTGLGTPRAGMLYYSTDINKMKFYDGTGWRVLRGDFDFQESVINFYDPTITLPVGPAAGDRYIASATGSGWTINWIYEYDGALWMGFQPTEGTTVEVEALNQYWHFNGAAWVLMASVFAHNNLSGIQGGAAAEYYHLAIQDQIYFVGKEGLDTNNGQTEGSKFLTFGAAIAAAVVAGPAANNIFTIVCFDSGIYDENITLPSHVNIFAPNATLRGLAAGTLTINSSCAAKFKEIITDIACAIAIRKPDVDTGVAYIEADRLFANSVINIINQGFANQGVLMVKIKTIYVFSGVGIGSAVTDFGPMHIDIGDIFMTANNGIAIARTGAGVSMEGRVDKISEQGVPGNITGISVVTGEVNININVINVDIAYNVAAAGTLRMFINSLTGTETVAAGGTACIVKACETQTSKTFHRIYDWLLFNGAASGTLNTGKITTTTLPKVSVDPGVQFKIDNRFFLTGQDMTIQVLCGHSTLTQTLDMDLNYVRTGVGLNLNTQVAAAVLNVTPVTPGTAYEGFVITFTIPGADIVQGGGIEFQLSRDTAGADTGDLEIWELRAYQTP